jgi:hypothetical protein
MCVSYLAHNPRLSLMYFQQVYLCTLTELTSHSSRNPAFNRSPSRSHIPSQLQMSTIHSPSLPVQSPSSLHKEPKEGRPILDSDSLQTLNRNAAEILAFHEKFFKELQSSLLQSGFHVPATSGSEPDAFSDGIQMTQRDADIGKIDKAVELISTKFATEVTLFFFCQPQCIVYSKASRRHASAYTNIIAPIIPVQWTSSDVPNKVIRPSGIPLNSGVRYLFPPFQSLFKLAQARRKSSSSQKQPPQRHRPQAHRPGRGHRLLRQWRVSFGSNTERKRVPTLPIIPGCPARNVSCSSTT